MLFLALAHSNIFFLHSVPSVHMKETKQAGHSPINQQTYQYFSCNHQNFQVLKGLKSQLSNVKTNQMVMCCFKMIPQEKVWRVNKVISWPASLLITCNSFTDLQHMLSCIPRILQGVFLCRGVMTIYHIINGLIHAREFDLVVVHGAWQAML